METSELRKSITAMTDDECHEYIAHLRKLRRTPPRKKAVAAKKVKSPEEIAASIPDELKKALLAKLQGKTDV